MPKMSGVSLFPNDQGISLSYRRRKNTRYFCCNRIVFHVLLTTFKFKVKQEKKNNNNKISVTTDNNHVLFTQTRITTTKSTTALVGHEQYMCVVRLCQCAHHMHCTRTLHSYTHTQ